MTDTTDASNPSESAITGSYICLEGPDGCGKTTATKLIKEIFAEHNKEFEEVNILSTLENSRKLRAIVTDPATVMHPRTELSYYIAAVLNTLTEFVQPKIRNGKIVLSDRGPDSSLVYQCFAFGEEDPSMMEMHRAAFAGLAPQMTIYLEPPEGKTSLDRVVAREEGKLDRIESRGEEYQHMVIQGYRMVAMAHVQRGMKVATVVNDGSIDELKEKLTEVLKNAGYLG